MTLRAMAPWKVVSTTADVTRNGVLPGGAAGDQTERPAKFKSFSQRRVAVDFFFFLAVGIRCEMLRNSVTWDMRVSPLSSANSVVEPLVPCEKSKSGREDGTRNEKVKSMLVRL